MNGYQLTKQYFAFAAANPGAGPKGGVIRMAPDTSTTLLGGPELLKELCGDELFAELSEEWEEMELFGSGWPPMPPEDPRWDTMQYHLQVHLKSSFDDDLSFLEPDDD